MKRWLLTSLLLIVLSGSGNVYAAAPTITSFSPLSGPVIPPGRTEVTITGTGFSTLESENAVFFGTIKVTPFLSSNTTIMVTVPAGFAYERITVEVNNLSVTSNQYFLVTSPYSCALTEHSFDAKVDFTTGFLSSYITSGDINNDGLTDLVSSNLSDGTISIYNNTTQINTIDPSSFVTTNITVGFGLSLSTVLLHDLNGDQKPELIVSNSQQTQIFIFPNTSSLGTISFDTKVTLSLTAGTTAKKFTIADMDADGKPDIITANSIGGSISLYRNTGNFTFDAPNTYSLPSNPEAITTGDLNRDGLPEIIVTMAQDGSIIIFQNKGSLASFFPTNTLATNNIGPKAIKLADFNRDGLLDIAVANAGTVASNRAITIFENDYPDGVKGVQAPVFVKAGNFTVPDEVSDIAIADFNGDGWPDMAASIKLVNSVVIYLNTLTASGTLNAASFTTPLSFPVEENPNGICVADFDYNGTTDIATVNLKGSVSVLKRALQQNPGGSMGTAAGPVQVTICPSTETSIVAVLSGKSPWTLKYRVSSFNVNQVETVTVTGNTDVNNNYTYLFDVSPEEDTRYEIIYVNDAQQCNNYTIYSNNYARVKVTPTPAIKPNTIPNAGLNSPYTQTYTLDPADPPLSWSISSGLPLGFDFASGVITGTTNDRNTYSFTVTAAFTNCAAIKQYHMLCTSNSTSTIWNGTSWSNGVPTSSIDAIIDGNYNTAVNGVFSCFHLAVNESDTLFIKGTNTITVTKNAINNGVIYKDCSAALAITGTFAGQAVKILQPRILPAFLTNGLVNLPYSQTLTVSIGESPTYTLAGTLPTGLSLTNGVIAGAPNKTGHYNFSVHSTENSGLCEASGNFTIIIETTDPTLKFPANGITKYTGTAPFSYTPTTKSKGTITYSIEPAGGCASVDANGMVTINCAEPIKQYTITAIQIADFIYKADTATTILTIEKSKPELRFAKTGYVLGSTTGNTIQHQTNSTGAVSVFQINNSNVAIVNMAGAVVPIAAGTFDILLKIAETSNFLAIDTVITMGVYSSYVPPVAVPIKVELEVGQDSTINILAKAQGITGAIDTTLTDIDTENTGVQYRFYSTELGNFLLDNLGNLSIRPFAGFIGEAKIGFVLTDENGTTSDIYYITVAVNPPYVIPDLKANETMTPNNDGLNDTFVIAYTDVSKENSLTILDEAGSTIYTANNYQNDWIGTTNKGDTLEPGVYFYAFTEKYSGRTLNGYIQIIK